LEPEDYDHTSGRDRRGKTEERSRKRKRKNTGEAENDAEQKQTKSTDYATTAPSQNTSVDKCQL
jgi:hypothetical protein